MQETLIVKAEEAVAIMTLVVSVPAMMMLINYLFKKGELLDWYYTFLCKWWDKWENSWKRKLLKPIGLCPYCMQVWVSVLYMVLFGVNIKYSLIIIPLNYLLLLMFMKRYEE